MLLSNGDGFEVDNDKERIWGTREKEGYHPHSPGFRLADLTGNGLPDLIYDSTADYDIHVLINKGNGFEDDKVWGTRKNGYNAYSGGFKMADLRGNGRADLVYAGSDGRNIHVLLNTGEKFDNDIVWGATARGYHEYSGGFKMADLSGDGRADFIYDSHDNKDIRVLLNTGEGFAADSVWGARSDAYNVSLPGFRMVDLNGSGMADFLYEGAGRKIQVLLSTGSGFMADRTWQTRSESIKNGSGSYQIADIKGSGVPSLIYCSTGATQNVKVLDSSPFPDLVHTVKNPIGGTFNIDYEPSSSYENLYLPYIVQTVKSIKAHDGTGDPPPTTHYSYSGGFHHRMEREFRGFETVSRSNEQDLLTSTITYFHQDRPGDPVSGLKGLARLQRVTLPQGKIYKETRYYYDVSETQTVLFPHLKNLYEDLYDGAQTPRTTRTEFVEYDSYGNLERKKFHGFTDVSGDEREEITVFLTNTVNWWLSFPLNTTIRDSVGNMAAKTSFEYEEDSTRLLRKTHFLDGLNDPTVSYTYEKPFGGASTGNVESVTDPNGNTTTTYYDSTRTLPRTVINASGHTRLFTYDYRFGKLKTEEDENQNITRYEYDSLGRIKKAISPYDYHEMCPSGVNCWTTLYDYDSFGSVGVQKVRISSNERSGQSGFLWKETYFDGLGREIKARAKGPDGKVIAAKTFYDPLLGSVARKSIPFFENMGTESYVEFEYDTLGRLTKTTNPDGSLTRTFYDRVETTFVNAKGQVKSEIKDAYGRLAKVVEHSGIYPSQSPYAETAYDYDALGNLTDVVDAYGNPTSIFYDLLSRKTSMIDPDMGEWRYEYDGNGNLTEQKDAGGKVISFEYDSLNRIKKKYCLTDPSIDSEYYYDEGSSQDNGKGRLTRVSDQSGTSRYSYDLLGRVSKTIKTIKINGIDVDYTSEVTYDALGRKETVTYPYRQGDTPETVEYLYDSAGNLFKVVGYAEYTGYNALGQVGKVEYYNGVTTGYDYDTLTGRLSRLRSPAPPEQATLQDLEYVYDEVGNIELIIDNLSSEKTQAFTYDHLNRLKTAYSDSYGTDPESRSISYDYDHIGNMTFNSRVGSYYYESSKPHAVTSAGGDTFTYDANGNMETRNGGERTFVFDAENRVRSITTGSGTVEFVYDHKGERVKKIKGGLETIYIGGVLEIRGSEITKHYFGGAKRAATRKGNNLYYTHSDHLGSLGFATDEQEQPKQETIYYPFGETARVIQNVGLNHKFTDQEEDPETGLYYYGARYYDPVIGRFISPDSIVPSPTNPQALNRYSYCYNNPLAYTDPSGHFPWLIALAAVALGAAAGASISAISGGNIGMGALTGAITAAAFFGAGQAIAAMGMVTKAGAYVSTQAFLGGTAIHAATGVATGAVNAAITGGDIGMSALTGGISGGMGHFVGGGIPRLNNPVANFGVNLAGRSLIGGVSGGIAAELYGGSFGQGFGQSAWTAGFGYTFNCAAPLVAYALYEAAVFTGTVLGAIYTGLVVGHYMNEGGSESDDSGVNDRKLDPKGELKKLDKTIKEDGIPSVEHLKTPGGKGAGKFDLWVKPNGDIVVKPKSGAGPGERTGYNIKDL